MMERSALAALQAFNVEVCKLTGAGKGSETTPEPIGFVELPDLGLKIEITTKGEVS